MARIKDVVFDCRRAAPLARFWAAALDAYDVRAYDEQEIERLGELGYTPETDPSVAVDGPGPTLFFQEVAEPKVVKNRVHLDLSSSDRRAEVARLVALGATVHFEGDGWTTLLDPEGNEFCVSDA